MDPPTTRPAAGMSTFLLIRLGTCVIPVALLDRGQPKTWLPLVQSGAMEHPEMDAPLLARALAHRADRRRRAAQNTCNI